MSPVREPLPRFLAPMLLVIGPAGGRERRSMGGRGQVRRDPRPAARRRRPRLVRALAARAATAARQFPELADARRRARRPPRGARRRARAPRRRRATGLRRPAPALERARRRRRRARERRYPATLIVFDVLHLDGRAVRVAALPRAPRATARAGPGRRALAARAGVDRAARRRAWPSRATHELEGVVFKRLDSVYRPVAARTRLAQAQAPPYRDARRRPPGRPASASPTRSISHASGPTGSRRSPAPCSSGSTASAASGCAISSASARTRRRRRRRIRPVHARRVTGRQHARAGSAARCAMRSSATCSSTRPREADGARSGQSSRASRRGEARCAHTRVRTYVRDE